MQLETHSNCKYDYVEVYENYRQNMFKRSRMCGTADVSTFTIHGDATINFHSDSGISESGFKILVETFKGIFKVRSVQEVLRLTAKYSCNVPIKYPYYTFISISNFLNLLSNNFWQAFSYIDLQASDLNGQCGFCFHSLLTTLFIFVD